MRSKRRKKASGVSRKKHYWSAEVTGRSNALDLEAGVFTQRDPRSIALSLQRSAERSQRRKLGVVESDGIRILFEKTPFFTPDQRIEALTSIERRVCSSDPDAMLTLTGVWGRPS